MIIKTRWTFRLFSLFILVLAVWLIIDSNQMNKKTNNPNNPDSFMTKIHAIQINKLGKLESILTGPQAKHYQIKNTTKFEKPYFIVHGKKGPPWHIKSDQGTAIDGTNQILLTGHVRIWQPPGPDSRNTTFTTTQVKFFPDRSFATTDKPVTIQQPSSTIHGVGLKADLNKGFLKLVSQAKGQYSTEPKPTTTPFKTHAR